VVERVESLSRTPGQVSSFLRSLSQTDSPLQGGSSSPIHIGEFFNAMAVMKDNVSWFEDRFAEMSQSPQALPPQNPEGGSTAEGSMQERTAENCLSQLRLMELSEQVESLEERLDRAHAEIGVTRELVQRTTERCEVPTHCVLPLDEPDACLPCSTARQRN